MKVISTPNAPAAIGPYAQGYIANGMVFTSGQLPVDPRRGNDAEALPRRRSRAAKMSAPCSRPAGPGSAA